LKQWDNANADWSKAIEVAPKHVRAALRWRRAAFCARGGHVDAAIQEAEELAKNGDANTLYNAACVLALSADRADETGGWLSKEECANRAVALLRQAVAKGFNDAEHMKKDDDLNALREREDFRKLLDELAAVPRARHHIELGEWQKAAADYDKLLELRPAFADVWFENAYLRLKCGNTKGYWELCRRMLEQFGQSEGVHEFAILAHTWVLVPQTPDDATRAVQLAEQRMSLTRADPIHGPWSVHVLSLAYYRSGLNDKAVECVAKGLKEQTKVECNLVNALVLAMAHYRLKHKDEAQKWLEQARQAIDQENRKRENDCAFAPPGWHWRDWLGVQMLREEAEELLGTKTEKK
jgi:tetratricopeptide (TPR) repeat protein